MNRLTPLRNSITLSVMDALQQLFFVVLISFTASYFIIKLALGYWKRRGILHDKPNVIWGHLKGVGRKRHLIDVLQNHYQKYQNRAVFVGFYVFLKPIILMIDRNSIERILLDDANDEHDLKTMNNDIVPQGFFFMPNNSLIRSNIKARQYYRENIEKLLPATVQFGHRFCNLLRQKINKPMQYDISQLVKDFFNDLIAEMVFGLKLYSIQSKDTEFHTMANAIKYNGNLYRTALAFTFPLPSNLLNNNWCDHNFRNFIKKLLLQRRSEQQTVADSQQYDYFKFLIHLQEDESQTYINEKEDEPLERFVSFIRSGLRILNTTLSCCLLELAMQPQIQHRARNEIQLVFSKHHDQINNESLKEMVYLQQIINEALRKYPPYPFVLRAVHKDCELTDSVYMLQHGNNIIIPIHAIHHDIRYYKQADKFHPEHFHSSEISHRPPAAFMPFGCLGTTSEVLQQLAMQQMSVCLIILLTMFSFTANETRFLPVEYDNSELFLKPKKSIELQVIPI